MSVCILLENVLMPARRSGTQISREKRAIGLLQEFELGAGTGRDRGVRDARSGLRGPR